MATFVENLRKIRGKAEGTFNRSLNAFMDLSPVEFGSRFLNRVAAPLPRDEKLLR